MTTEIRLRSKVSAGTIEGVVGKLVTPAEIDVMLTGPTTVYLPDGQLLCKYLPGAFPEEYLARFYPTLHELRALQTDNRGMAGGAPAVKKSAVSTRQRGLPVASGIIGSFDAAPPKMYCRLTAWSGKEWGKYATLFPLFGAISKLFAEHVPDRWQAQMRYIQKVHPDWVIPQTAFTTVTVNNSYPTGVHTDRGDLDEGFSTLSVLRRGNYSGGFLTFPEYRVAVDMQHGDLLLMDAHQWHGNTPMVCGACGKRMGRPREDSPTSQEFHDVTCGAERISVVSYMRTKMTECGSPEEEAARARDWAEHRISLQEQLVEEMAQEAVGG